MKKRYTFYQVLVTTALALLLFFSCSDNPEEKSHVEKAVVVEDHEVIKAAEEIKEPIGFKDIMGRWSLTYRGNFGYDFRFYKNYKSIVTIYISTHSLVFKGVYNIADNNRIRINIYEMKRTPKVSGINLHRGFMKSKSSYFIFKAGIYKKGRKKILLVTPETIMIDGNNSDGYFEPSIKLQRQ